MPYVMRNNAGHIIAVLSENAEGAQQVSCHDLELSSFLNLESPERKAAQALLKSDHGLVRVLEDLINILIEAGTVRFSDFPEPARHKLLSRQRIRAGLTPTDERSDIAATVRRNPLESDTDADSFL